MSTDPAYNHRISRLDLFVIGLYTVLMGLYTWPLLLHLSTHVLGGPGDGFDFLWKMWWVAHAVLDEQINPFFNPRVYYPSGYFLAYAPITPLNSFLLAPLTKLLGETFTYNLSMLVSGPLTGWITYRWARRLLARQPDLSPEAAATAAIFAGLVVAFNPLRYERLGGQLDLAQTQWVVLFFLTLDRWLEEPGIRRGIWLIFTANLVVLSSWYYALVIVLLAPVYVLAFAPDYRALLVDRRVWTTVLIGVAVSVVLSGPFVVAQMRVPGEAGVSLDQAITWAASPTDYLVLNPNHPLLHRLYERAGLGVLATTPGEFHLSPGFVVLLFAMLGWRLTEGRSWRALKWLLVAAFVLSLGPVLTVFHASTGVPLPVWALRAILPLARQPRSWARFGAVVQIGLSLLAAPGLAHTLAEREKRWQHRLIAGGVAAAYLFGLWSVPFELTSTAARPVDGWLAEQPGDFAIMQYPLETALSGEALYHSRHHGKKIVFACCGHYFPLSYIPDHPALVTFPSDEALDQLAAWEVRYVLVDVAAQEELDPPYSLVDIADQSRLHFVGQFGGQAVYELLGK